MTHVVVGDAVQPDAARGRCCSARDDDGDGGPHSDTSAARNLELELRLGRRTMARHGNLAAVRVAESHRRAGDFTFGDHPNSTT